MYYINDKGTIAKLIAYDDVDNLAIVVINDEAVEMTTQQFDNEFKKMGIGR